MAPKFSYFHFVNLSCIWMYCLHVCLCTMQVAEEARQVCWIPRTSVTGRLWAMWVLGIRLGSSAKAASTLNCRVVSPAPMSALILICSRKFSKDVNTDKKKKPNTLNFNYRLKIATWNKNTTWTEWIQKTDCMLKDPKPYKCLRFIPDFGVQ